MFHQARSSSRGVFLSLFALLVALTSFDLFARVAVLEEQAVLVSPDPAFPLSPNVMALDGNTLLVGGYYRATESLQQPEVALFHFERQADGTWQSMGALIRTLWNEVDPGGFAVALEGNTAVVALGRRNLQVLERGPNGWTASNLNPGGSYASDVVIHNGVIAIGGLKQSRSAITLMKKVSGVWTVTDTLLAGNRYPDDGFVGPDIEFVGNQAVAQHWSASGEHYELHVFDLIGTQWQHTDVFVDPIGLPARGIFRAISRDKIAFVRQGTVETGTFAALATRNSSGEWLLPEGSLRSEETFPLIGIGAAKLYFDYGDTGTEVFVSGTLAYTGAFDDDIRGEDSGAVKVFERNAAGDYIHAATLVASDATPSALLGGTVRVSGRTVAAGARGARAVYIYEVPQTLPATFRVEDTFEDMNAAGWTPWGYTSWSVAASGDTRVYRQTNTQGDARSILDAPESGNQSIQADLKVNATVGPSPWAGLMVRYVDASNFYYLLVNANTIQIRRNVGGVFGPIASTSFARAPGRTYQYRLEAVGTWLRAYVDGRLVLQVRDTSLSTGRVGLAMWKTSADYDNIVVSSSPLTFLHKDSFGPPNDYGSPPWSLTPAGAWSHATVNGGQTVLWQSMASGDARAVNGAPSTDQIVTADITPLTFHHGGTGWVGLMARYVDNRNYYYVLLTDSNRVSLRKWVNGVITVLDEAPMNVDLGVAYRARLEAIGSSLRLYVNDRLVAEASDTALPQGRYGLVTYNASAHFDNFSAVSP